MTMFDNSLEGVLKYHYLERVTPSLVFKVFYISSMRDYRRYRRIARSIN